MKPLAENRHVERILSLIVILYGLRLMIPVGEESVQYIGWLPVLPRATVGCLLFIFFPYVVQAIGYFATERTPRLKRLWFASEIVAIPIQNRIIPGRKRTYVRIAFKGARPIHAARLVHLYL